MLEPICTNALSIVSVYGGGWIRSEKYDCILGQHVVWVVLVYGDSYFDRNDYKHRLHIWVIFELFNKVCCVL